MHCIRGGAASSDERTCGAKNQRGDAKKGDPPQTGSKQARRAKRGTCLRLVSYRGLHSTKKSPAPTVRKFPSLLGTRRQLVRNLLSSRLDITTANSKTNCQNTVWVFARAIGVSQARKKKGKAACFVCEHQKSSYLASSSTSGSKKESISPAFSSFSFLLFSFSSFLYVILCQCLGQCLRRKGLCRLHAPLDLVRRHVLRLSLR